MRAKVPLPSGKYELNIPDNQTPEGWLSQLDSDPVVIPTWPLSLRMTLVVVVAYADAKDEESHAYVLTDPKDVEAFSHHPSVFAGDHLALYFTVLRKRVIPLTTGLSEESWVD